MLTLSWKGIQNLVPHSVGLGANGLSIYRHFAHVLPAFVNKAAKKLAELEKLERQPQGPIPDSMIRSKAVLLNGEMVPCSVRGNHADDDLRALYFQSCSGSCATRSGVGAEAWYNPISKRMLHWPIRPYLIAVGISGWWIWSERYLWVRPLGCTRSTEHGEPIS